MNVVIIGAGTVGIHLASLLSKGEHNVVLVDRDHEVLERISWQLDIATRTGSGTDWELLEALLADSPDVFIALTESDEANFVACSIAKTLGYKKTIARIREGIFLDTSRIDFSRQFHVDHYVSPELLVAYEMRKHVLSSTTLHHESFAHGSIQMRTIKVPSSWSDSGRSIAQLGLPENVTVGLIKRGTEGDQGESAGDEGVSIPHGDDCILPDDEITLIGETDAITSIHRFFGAEGHRIRFVTVIGGTRTAVHFCQMLEKLRVGVKLIDPNRKTCEYLSGILTKTTIIHGDPTDIDLLRAEKVDTTDLLVACTFEDEINILTVMLGHEIGCKESIVMLTNPHYVPIVERMGISHVVSPRVFAANRILSLVLSGRITSLVSLYNDAAEILEVSVSPNSQIAGIPLKELTTIFPRDFLVGAIENRGRAMVARGEHVISPRDLVIAITRPRYQKFLEEVF
ncbi:MAG: Trk system potassium transporter TrkA [Chlamydiia bacterium]|nr:Trk system potassium transporter TrkA [Chlamydiia bacterium]